MPEPTTRLAEIQARAAAATPGPWQNDQAELHQAIPGAPEIWVAWIGEALNIDDLPKSNHNAAFIAHAREDIPYLLVQLHQRDAEIAELQTKLAVRERQLSDMDAGVIA
ncbi:hypothetical protein ACFVZJ_21170 [Streptomyces sp. NPDC058322]|uniref:hypothetical protein n=1 Tax=Streptomyces sp. NPDC058322 TaxID=3346446 RepID=UPI0036E12528